MEIATDIDKVFYPTISIITVTYNAADDLEKTVQSVVNQTYDNIEYIIIDGKSTDNTQIILDKYKEKITKIISEPDKGIYDAMNKGISLASGQYLHFLNAGDYFYCEESLQKLISSAGKEYDIIYGDIELVQVNGRKSHHRAKEFNLINLLKFGTGVICHQAMLVRRDIASLYDLKYTFKGELNWYFDFFKEGKGVSYFHYNSPVVYYFLGGLGYKYFIKNRLEWYTILIKRFGVRSVFNKQFIGFIYNDFKNRYGFSK